MELLPSPVNGAWVPEWARRIQLQNRGYGDIMRDRKGKEISSRRPGRGSHRRAPVATDVVDLGTLTPQKGREPKPRVTKMKIFAVQKKGGKKKAQNVRLYPQMWSDLSALADELTRQTEGKWSMNRVIEQILEVGIEQAWVDLGGRPETRRDKK